MKQAMLKHKLVLFYVITYVISWSAWFVMWRIYQSGQWSPLVYLFSTLGALGPLLALLILERLTKKELSLRQVFTQIKLRGAKRIWFLPAIVALPLITLLSNVGNYLLGREPVFRLINPGPDALGMWMLPVMIIHFAASLLTSPLFEEPGWRGFALGELQAKFGRELGSLSVGLLWWLWHQPMNLTFGIQPSLYAALSMLALSFMIDSLFNLSDKNLFTAMLAHQSSGTVILFFYQGSANWLQLTLLTGFVLWLRWREREQVSSSVSGGVTMLVNQEAIAIAQAEALALCQKIRYENAGKFWSPAYWQCWGCVKFSKGDAAKMCFSNAPGNRGCIWVNQRFDQKNI